MSGLRARVAVGVALGAVLLTGCGSEDSSDGSASSTGGSSDRELQLPDALGDLQPYEDVCASLEGDAQQRCTDAAAGSTDAAQAAADNLSAAYDGASAVGAEYADEGFDHLVQVFAVAAPSPGLWTTDSEAAAARQQLGHPMEWVEEGDGAQCVVRSQSPVPEGEDVDPESVVVLRCQQTGDDLTVTVIPGGDATLEDALAWTGAAFEDVAG
ncbi:MAG TPA: hypothetical protein VGE14_16250 [Marmoricola sp.]